MGARNKKAYSKILDITECGICHSDLCDPRRIECGHIFCLNCLSNEVYNKFCPTCKRPMNPNLGKVENYPVADDIVHLLQSLQRLALQIDVNTTKKESGNIYEEVDNQSSTENASLGDVCDIHRQKLVSVCLTCDELICVKCNIHAAHEKRGISDYTTYVEQILDGQKHELVQRGKNEAAEDEHLQSMIEKKIMETDSIRNEIEEIAEEMQGSIHRKKEEIIHPIETNADVFVKLLTERQEHIKERVSEFSLICEKIETLSNDGTVEYLRKTQRLVKKAKIALEEDESISLPEYQTFTFIKNQTVVEDLSKLELGDVVVPVLEELIYNDSSDDSTEYDDTSTTYQSFSETEQDDKKVKSNAKRRDAYYEAVTLPQPSGYACSNESTNHGYTNVQIHNDRDNPPPIPPRHDLTQATSSDADNEYHYVKPLYDNTLKRENNERTIILQQPTVATTKLAAISKAANAAANTIYRSLQPPPLPPFSGAFRNSISIASNNRIFPHKVIHRVYLQFRPLGFTVVRNKAAIYYAFVTTQDHSVQIFKQNGDFVRTISDLTKPFDIASQQHGDSPVNIYVTDAGRRTGDGCVRVYNSEGIFVKSLAGKLRKPRGIAVSRVGLVYVCDEANILVLCPDTGKKKRVISSIGKYPLFVMPMYVMVSATGKILVSDVGTRQLNIHDETRKYTDTFQPSNKDEELYASFCPGMCSEDSSSNYYVVDQERNSLYMLGGGGKYEKMELPDKPIGHDGIPTAVTFDANTGDIIVF